MPHPAHAPAAVPDAADVRMARMQLEGIAAAVATVWRGERATVDLLVCAWASAGHVLIEDVPGMGKTTLARALASAIGGPFRRIQGTPDLMPADITGLSVFDQATRQFVFHPGPVFTEVLLADELNRAPPRSQSALLEALAENQVTVDGERRVLPSRFFCVATENPHDQVGTYPLPDASRDRFLMRVALGHPSESDELAVLAADGADRALAAVSAITAPEEADRLRQLVRSVRVAGEVRGYLLQVVRATRTGRGFAAGASTRAALGLQRAVQARALLHGRAFATPDDVQALAVPCLAHRVSMRSGGDAAAALRTAIEQLPVPR